MWDYMIAHYAKENEWSVMRVSEDDAQWLNSKNEWTREKRWARRFYNEDDARWTLVLAKIKWWKEEEPERPEVEKQSWDELSSD